MSDWITIAEAKEIYGKSETTMRNLVRKLKASKSKNLKIEKSPNGRDMVRFKRSFLDSQFNISVDKESDKKALEIADSQIVVFLKQQIEIKDKQIDQLSHLLNDEKKNVKMLMNQSGYSDFMAKEKPQEVAQDGSSKWIILFVLSVLIALGYSVLTLI
jgi:dsDNA-binding SOS-regulon protein